MFGSNHREKIDVYLYVDYKFLIIDLIYLISLIVTLFFWN